MLRKRILIHFLCHIIFYHTFYLYIWQWRTANHFWLTQLIIFIIKKLLHFLTALSLITSSPQICTTFLTIMSAAFKFYGHRKQITASSIFCHRGHCRKMVFMRETINQYSHQHSTRQLSWPYSHPYSWKHHTETELTFWTCLVVVGLKKRQHWTYNGFNKTKQSCIKGKIISLGTTS